MKRPGRRAATTSAFTSARSANRQGTNTIEGALCALVIRLQTFQSSKRQNPSQNSPRYLNKVSLPIARA